MRGCAWLLLGFLSTGPAFAQSRIDCATPDCGNAVQQGAGDPERPSVQQIWAAAAQIHQLKQEFVAAVGLFTQAQSGTFGDEAAALESSVEAMRRALGRWDAAVREYEAGLSIFFGDAEVHVALGTVYLDRHRTREALREFQAAARRDSTRPDVHLLQALAYGLAERPAEAAEALQKATTLDPDHPVAWYTLAQHLRGLNRRDEASQALRRFHALMQRPEIAAAARARGAPFERVDLLRQASGVAPIFPIGGYAEGYAALEQGDYSAAVARFREAMRGDPLNAGSASVRQRVAAGGAALREGRFPDALRLLEGVVVDAPAHAEGHRVLGLAYWLDGQHDRGIEHLTAAVRLRPDDERARMTLSAVLVAAGRFDEAEVALEEWLGLAPRSGQAHYRRGLLYQRRSLFLQAGQAFERSAMLAPVVGRDHLYQTMGSVYVNHSDLDAAVRAYARRVDVNPNSAEAHTQLGEIYFLQGQHDEALAEFSAALLIDPRSARAHAGSGQVHLRLRRHREAADALRQAVEFGGGDAETRYALGTALLRLGEQRDGAREHELSQRLRAEAMARGQREFQLDALRREAARHSSGGNHDEAVALLEQLVGLDSGGVTAHRELGAALLGAGRLQEAIDRFLTAQQLEATPHVYEHLADAYRRLGQTAQADRAIALRDDLLEARRQGRLRELTGAR